MRSHWDTSSIEAMESTARNEADGQCALQIRGEWLTVAWITSGRRRHYVYRWGKNYVPREVAASVLESRETEP